MVYKISILIIFITNGSFLENVSFSNAHNIVMSNNFKKGYMKQKNSNIYPKFVELEGFRKREPADKCHSCSKKGFSSLFSSKIKDRIFLPKQITEEVRLPFLLKQYLLIH